MNNKQTYDFRLGEVLLVNKPLNWTSFDVVNKIRYSIKHRLGINKIKVGHAGTLDPLADGLLIICTGKKTKSIESFMDLTKGYSGSISIGATTPSYDLETAINASYDTGKINNDLIYQQAKNMLGEMDQFPPAFSAKKVAGKKAYDLARKGQKVKLKSNRICIKRFDIRSIDLPKIKFYIECSKGTYIRSIAHDFGKGLNNGAHLTALRRESIGEFSLEDAYELDFLIELIETSDLINIASD